MYEISANLKNVWSKIFIFYVCKEQLRMVLTKGSGVKLAQRDHRNPKIAIVGKQNGWRSDLGLETLV